MDTPLTILCVVAAAAAVFTMLVAIASRLEYGWQIHMLRVDAFRLRAEYERRLAAMRAGRMGEVNVDFVDDGDMTNVDIIDEPAGPIPEGVELGEAVEAPTPPSPPPPPPRQARQAA